MKKFLSLVLVIFLGVVMYGCGGGGGKTGPAQITDATSGETVVAAVAEVSGETIGDLEGFGYEFPSEVKIKKQKLSKILKPLVGKKGKKMMIWEPTCSSGSANITALQSGDKKTITVTAVYDGCVESWDYNGYTSTETLNGKIVGKYTNSTWTTTIPDAEDPPVEFIEGINKVVGTYDDMESEWKDYENGTIQEHGTSKVNASVVVDIYSDIKWSFTFNGVVNEKDILEEEEFTLTYKNFALLLEMITEGTEEVEKITVNGGVTYSAPGEKTESVSFSNYIGKEWEITDGEMRTIDGGMTLNLSCLKGTVTIETTEAIFTPWTSDYCPTDGTIVISGSGTAKIEYTPTGGAEIYVDDELVKTASSCDDLETCPEIGKQKTSKAGCRWGKLIKRG